jgi:hypothetical protein
MHMRGYVEINEKAGKKMTMFLMRAAAYGLILKKQQRGGVMGYEEVLCLCSHENLSHTQPVLLLWIISHPVQRNCTMHILTEVDHCRDRDHEIPVQMYIM